MKVEKTYCDICEKEIRESKNKFTYTDIKLSPVYGTACHPKVYKDVCNTCTLSIVDFINEAIRSK